MHYGACDQNKDNLSSGEGEGSGVTSSQSMDGSGEQISMQEQLYSDEDTPLPVSEFVSIGDFFTSSDWTDSNNELYLVAREQ